MYSVPTELIAAHRARWLAEAAQALNEARGLLMELSLIGETSATGREAFLRIEAALLEVQSLRLSRSLHRPVEIDPQWTESSPWRSDNGSR